MRTRNTKAEAEAAADCMRVCLRMLKLDDVSTRMFARGFQAGVRMLIKELPWARRQVAGLARFNRHLAATEQIINSRNRRRYVSRQV